MNPLKKCSTCKVPKSLNDFYNDRSQLDGKNNRCKPCANEAHSKYQNKHSSKNTVVKTYKKQNYILSPVIYNEILLQQKGLCVICGKVCKSGKRLAVDHDHKTNNFRGLLCVKCNTGLGQFNDDLTLLQNAINYLNNSNKPMKNKAKVLAQLESVRQRIRNINYLFRTNGKFDELEKAFEETFEVLENAESLVSIEEDAFRSNQII